METKIKNDQLITELKPDLFGGFVETLEKRKFHDFFTSLEITSDSVVAKVRIVTNEKTRRILIDWGDLESDSIRVVPGVKFDLSAIDAQSNPLPDGTYEIFHAYEMPEERNTFERHITIRIEDGKGRVDQRSETIILVPKYRINVYRASVQQRSKCDRLLFPWDNPSSNFEITRTINGEEGIRWRWRPSNSFISDAIFSILPASQFETIYEIGGNSTFLIYNFREFDTISADDTGRHFNTLGRSTETGLVEQDVRVGGCTVRIKYEVEVALIKPLPSVGSRLTFSKVSQG